MRSLLVALLLMVPFASQPAHCATAYYFPTPYPSTVDENIHHIWDGWITNIYYGKRFVQDDRLQVGGWGDNYRTYIKFDLKGLPATVDHAIVWLRPYPRGDQSTPVNFDIWRVAGGWTTGMTWGTQPSVQLYGSYVAPPTNQYWGFYITQIYRDWQNGTLVNHGFRMDPWTTNNQFNVFRSSRYTPDRTHRPHLQLDFTPPVTIPDFRLPLPGGVSWLVTTETGGYDCQGIYDPNHDNGNWFSIDFSWRNQGLDGNRVYADPNVSNVDIPVIAASGGTVEAIGDDPNHPNGYYVVVDHDYDENINTGFTTRYLHLKYPPSLSLHENVTQGELLGYMGTTGRDSNGNPTSTGVHLHFGVRYNNTGAVARSELTYVTMEGLLLKGFQTECANGDYVRYYRSSNRAY